VPGEFAWIATVRDALGRGRTGVEGIGHDGVVLRAEDGRVVVCDTMVEGIHFRRGWSSIQDVGWKLVASNISDLWAMGARPSAWFLSVAVDDADEWFPPLIEGFADALERFAPNAALVGGDTTRAAPGHAVLTVTFVGTARRPSGRGGAQPGDTVWVDGPIGWAAAGLEALRRGEEMLPDVRDLVVVHRRPLLGFSAAGPAPEQMTACVDVSDGLSADLWHLATASGVRIVLDAGDRLPGHDALADVASRWGTDPLAWQLAGGDDYVRVGCSAGPLAPPWRPIGRVESGEPSLTLIGPDDSARVLVPEGYRHFPERPGGVP
jgi:thiamine-monophosphate kinase